MSALACGALLLLGTPQHESVLSCLASGVLHASAARLSIQVSAPISALPLSLPSVQVSAGHAALPRPPAYFAQTLALLFALK